MKLSENFTLQELTVSATGARLGLDNNPPPDAIASLRRLCELVLQPLRDHLGRPVVVLSGYRSLAVNTAVGGAKNSAHMKGRAADIIVPGMTARQVCQTIVGMGLPYKQLIHEYHQWAHVEVTPENQYPARERLTATHTPAGTVYTQGIA